MEAFTGYLLRSVAWLTGFALVYLLFLRNERFFQLKRAYLMTGILVSLILPLISVHYQVEVPAPAVSNFSTPDTNISASSAIPATSQGKPIDYKIILLGLYISGIIFLGYRIVHHLVLIRKTINKANINSIGPAKLVRVSLFPASFSFFNYVFINPSVDEAEVREIMNHELVHVKQKHWLDLFLVEMLRLFQWINPFVWIYTGFIRLNNEYLADEMALQRTSNPGNYKAALMNQLFRSPVISLSNSFNYSLNKKRFEMMKRIITSPYRRLKVLLVLPVFAVVLYAFAEPEYHYTASNDNTDQITTIPAIRDITVTGSGTDTQVPGSINIRNVNDGTIPDTLIIIDGVITDKKNFDGLSPADIASISVRKDPAATAPYGEKGKNGVIIITTKKSLQKPVKGVVVDKEGKPLQGTYITSTGTSGNARMSETGSDGRFVIEAVQPDASLLFFCRGYKQLTLKPDFNAEMKVIMEVDPEYKAPAVKNISVTEIPQRPEPVVAIDGVISEKNIRDARKDLGYDYGLMKLLTGKEATEKYGDKGINGIIEITTRKKALEMGIKTPFPRLAPTDFPTFSNQENTSFVNWVISQTKYPVEAQGKKIEGYVSVYYTVELDGTLSNVNASPSVDPILGNEIVRVIKSSPRWDPPKNPNVDEPLTSSLSLRFKLPGQIEYYEEPFVVVEEMPMYPGGDGELLKYLTENTKYPEAAKAEKIQGRVIIRFFVSTEGTAEEVTVLKGVDARLDAEAVRVVSTLKGFKPGMQGGKPVNVWYMVPITFSLPKTDNPQ